MATTPAHFMLLMAQLLGIPVHGCSVQPRILRCTRQACRSGSLVLVLGAYAKAAPQTLTKVSLAQMDS